MIGGISYFHEFAYDLLAENERILAATFDGAIAAHRDGHLERIIVVSSSMVYESATVFPTPEGAQLTSPPPISTYGFQKLASEYFAKGAWEQYQLPYTIVRPFNCVGIGERRALRDTDIMSGNVKLALSHVVPGPRPQDPQGPGPAPHPRRGRPGPPLHVRRRPRPRHPPRDGIAGGGQRRLQPLDRRVDDGPRAGRGDLAQDPHRRPTVPLRQRPALRARRPAPRAGRPQGARGARLRGDDDARPDARRGHPVDPGGVGAPAGCDGARRCCRVVMPVFNEGEAVEPVLRALSAACHDAARDPRRLRLRRGPDRPGHRPARRRASRPSAGCATTSVAACSTR